MSNVLNTTYDFEMADGTIVPLTLSFYSLYQLRSKKKGLYDRYNKIMTSAAKGSIEELDSITMLYVAYICANNTDEIMSEEEFIIKCGADRQSVNKAIEHLISPKKA